MKKRFGIRKGRSKAETDTYSAAWNAWCAAVLREVRFRPDHPAIRKELMAHLEDGRADLERLGYDTALAEQRALEAMGSAFVVGCAMDQAHHPFWGWLWRLTRWLMLALLAAAVGITVRDSGTVNDALNRTAEQLQWTEPAAGADRVETEYATLWLAPGEVTEEGGVFQADLYIWVEMQDPFGYSPDGLWGYLEVADDRGAVPCYARQPDGTWPETGWWSYWGRGTDISWTRYQDTIRLTLDHRPAWAEITYPYGKNDWTLRAEWEGAS